MAYANSRREVAPAIYNENRLREKPLPDTESEIDLPVDSTAEDDQVFDRSVEAPLAENETVENGFENGNPENGGAAGLVTGSNDDVELNFSDMDISQHVIASVIDTEHVGNTTADVIDAVIGALDMSLGISVTDATENDQAQNISDTETDVKPETVPVFEPLASNNTALDSLLQARSESEVVVEIVGDMTITRIRGQILKPLRTTEKGLVKREKDVVSGQMPFNENVS